MADDVTIRVVVRDATRGGVGSVRNSLQGIARGAGMLGASSGGVMALTGGLTDLLGVVALVPAALTMAAATVSVFKIALGGVSEALTASSGGASSAGTNYAAFARQVRDANRAIEDAQRGVADANRALQDAYRGVDAAERQVVSAKRDVARAGRDYERALDDEQAALGRIDDARRDAIRTLEDLEEAQSDSVRSVVGAEIALKRARESQVKANKDVKATALDREEAAFRVSEAEDRLSDSQREAADATEKFDTAQRKGVEGSDQVVAAQAAAAAAHERTEAAAEGVVSAQEGLQDAYRGVEDAQRGVEDAERGVEDAHRAVADAVQRLDDVYAQQAEQAKAAAGGVDAYAEALKNLSPEAREVVKTLRGLSDEWQEVKFAVQDAFFEGTAEDIQDLAGIYLPLLKSGLSGIAGELNDMGDYAFDQLMDPAVVAAVNKVLGNTSKLLDNAETALGDFISGFLQLAGIGSDYLPGIGTWLADIGANFREWVETDPEGVREFIESALEGFEDLGEIIGNVIDFFSALFGGLAEGTANGEGFLDLVADMTQSLVDFVESEGVQAVLSVLGTIFRMIFETIPIWGPVAAGMLLVAGAMAVVNAIFMANPIFLVIIAITALVSAFVWLWNNVEGFRNFWIGAWEGVQYAFFLARDSIVGGFWWLMDQIGIISDNVSGFLGGMWDGLEEGAKTAVNGAIWVLNGLISGVNFVVDALNAVNPFAPIGHVGYIPYLARGGIASGLAVVGENGPELVDLPAGSRVHPAGDSERMMEGGGRRRGGGGALELRVAPGADSALASLLMRMVRTGELELVPAS